MGVVDVLTLSPTSLDFDLGIQDPESKALKSQRGLCRAALVPVLGADTPSASRAVGGMIG